MHHSAAKSKMLSLLFLLLVSTQVLPTTTATATVTSASGSVCHGDAGILGSGSGHLDRMTHMPGFNQPLPTPWFSGYLDYEFEGRQVHTHYVLVLAEDNNDWDDEKPLIYWSNGGPGASSLFGLLTELGPLILSDDSLNTNDYKTTGIPTPIYNPYSLSRLGHLLIIDQPAPIGFSYCGNETESHSCGGIAWTDELTSLNAYTALQTFFQTKFPCLNKLPFYLTGESYGGIYIPTLARRILDNNNENNMIANDDNDNGDNEDGETSTETKSYLSIPLQGFAVGDGCLGVETTMCGGLSKGTNAKLFRDFWYVLFLAGHHQIPLQDFQKVMKACAHIHTDNTSNGNNNGNHYNPQFLMTNSKEDEDCKAILKQVRTEVGGFFEYALYDECTYRNGLMSHEMATGGVSATARGALNDYACGGGPVMEEYFRMQTVKDAFHVHSTFFEVDNAEGDFDYTPTEPDLTGFYQHVVTNTSLRVLVYNGDTDPAITSFATANWTSNLGLKEIQHWRPWTSDSCQKVGGYVTRYEGDFDFLTIRGAGHMVPTYKPEATFAFFQAWILGDDYLPYDSNCTQPTTRAGAKRSKMSLNKNINEIGQADNSSDETKVSGPEKTSLLRG